jgi:hypothetical protein
MVEEIDIDALEVFVEDDEPLYDVQIIDSVPVLESAEEVAEELFDGFSPPFDYRNFLRVCPLHAVMMVVAILILLRIMGLKSLLMGSDGGSSVAVDVDSLGGREHITSIMSTVGDPEVFAQRLAAAVDARLQGLAEAEAQKGQRRRGGRMPRRWRHCSDCRRQRARSTRTPLRILVHPMMSSS